MSERIMITGLGVVSPLGNSPQEVWQRVSSGRDVFRPLTSVDTSGYVSKIGAEVVSFETTPYISAMQSRKMDRLSLMTTVAAFQAIEDAQLSECIAQNPRVGIVMGTGLGSTAFTDDFFVGMVKKGPASANPMLFPNTVPNAAASYVSILLKFRGLNTTFCHKEVSSEQAFSYAVSQLRRNKADVLLVGGTEEISSFLFHAFSVTKALAPRNREFPEEMAPYDQRRNGLVMGEGAAILILEREEHFLKRNGRAYGEVLGVAMRSQPVGPLGYDPLGQDIEAALLAACHTSNIPPSAIDCFSGAANSTTILDHAELQALERVLAENREDVPLTALKAYTGCFHGNGGLRLLIACKMLEHSYVPGIPHLKQPLEHRHIKLSTDTGLERNINVLAHLGSSYGGCSVAIVLKK